MQEISGIRIGDNKSMLHSKPLVMGEAKMEAVPKDSILIGENAANPEIMPSPIEMKSHASYHVDDDPNVKGSGIGTGYQPDFIGSEWKVPLPEVTGAAKDEVLHLKNGDTERKYTHFSIVMNKDRKIAFFTAHNIDGTSVDYSVKRGKWELDPVVGEQNQMGEDMYSNNPIDRGHLVRRQAVIWGPKNEAKIANQDTFFYTNASPQHKDMNQKTWLNLENWLLQKADEKDKRISVFTGPVLRDDDVKYRGEQIPADFWKVVVLERESDHQLAAAAFMISQKDLISHLGNKKEGKSHHNNNIYNNYNNGADAGIEAVDTSTVAPFQVPLKEIEDLTHLSFGNLKDVDAYALYEEEKSRAVKEAMAAHGILAGAVTEEKPRRMIKSMDDIII